MRNYFGLENYEIKDIIQDKSLADKLRKLFNFILKQAKVEGSKADNIISDIFSIVRTYNNLADYEKNARNILEKTDIGKEIPRQLDERADIVYNHIKEFIKGDSVLDFGCGDGKIGEHIVKKRGSEVLLMDIYKHPNIDNIDLEFKLIDRTKLPLLEDRLFDTTLALMVFHHCNDPFFSLEQIKSVTKKDGRILVIESVYGVDGSGLNDEQKQISKNYLDLNSEEQRKANIFFDHFYNRVLHYGESFEMKVNVPFNFNTPENWKKIFEKHGLEQLEIKELGIDILIVPEYHTLHILKIKN